HVVGIVNIAMLGMQADKAASTGNGGVGLPGHKIGINQFQLRLFGIGAEGKVFFQALQVANSGFPLTSVELGFSSVVKICFAGIFWLLGAGTGRQKHQGAEKQGMENSHKTVNSQKRNE